MVLPVSHANRFITTYYYGYLINDVKYVIINIGKSSGTETVTLINYKLI